MPPPFAFLSNRKGAANPSMATLNCEKWPNFSYRGVRSVQLLLLLLLLMVFSSENFGFSPPYAGIAGIGLAYWIPWVPDTGKPRSNPNVMLCWYF